MRLASGQRRLRLGTRGSALALRQAEIVIEALRKAAPNVQVETKVIRTHGDELLAGPPPEESVNGGPSFGEGVFVRAIENALLEQRVDLAVHSFKDMPSHGAPGLVIGAFPPRDDPRDVLVAHRGDSLRTLPQGARVATGSPRRRALLLAARPDLTVEPIRGNVDTRLHKVAESDLDRKSVV